MTIHQTQLLNIHLPAAAMYVNRPKRQSIWWINYFGIWELWKRARLTKSNNLEIHLEMFTARKCSPCSRWSMNAKLKSRKILQLFWRRNGIRDCQMNVTVGDIHAPRKKNVISQYNNVFSCVESAFLRRYVYYQNTGNHRHRPLSWRESYRFLIATHCEQEHFEIVFFNLC